MRWLRFGVVCVVALLPALPAQAYVSRTESFDATKIASPPPMDPALDAPIWKSALKADGFYDLTARKPARFPTTAYFLYDDKYLYVAFECVQRNVPITAVQNVDNAGVDSDDHVSFSVDTSGSGSRSYWFDVNAKGVHAARSIGNSRYAPPWKSLAQKSADGYNVLMVIPLSDIRGASTRVQSWRMNFSRFVSSSGDSYSWAYDPTAMGSYSPSSWPWVKGIRITATAARPKPHADIYALESAGSDRDQFEDAVGNFQTMSPRPLGVDWTVPVSNTMSFVGTLNPDFSNVERDEVSIAPQEFPRLLAEYRPFFSQGSSYLNQAGGGGELFYSPSIGVFNRGLQVEGTTGQSSLGVLNVSGDGVDDTAAGYGYTKLDQSLNFGYTGVFADHGGLHDMTNAVSALFTNPHSGFDTHLTLASESGTLVSDPAQANSLRLSTGIFSTHWQALVAYKDIGPEYDPIDGYIDINDVRGPTAILGYSGTSGGAIKSYNFMANGSRYTDRSGATHEAAMTAGAGLEFKNQLGVQLGVNTNELRYYTQAYPVYLGAQDLVFNQRSIGISYRQFSPSPVSFDYSWGPFEDMWVQQLGGTTSRNFGPYGISFELDGTVDRPLLGSLLPQGSQWLRRYSISRSFGTDGNLSIGFRTISGSSAFAASGTNLSFAYHQRLRNQDELWLDYGTPAAIQTLHRMIFKYVFHTGGSTGT